jgi:hypothetical protein
MLKYFTNAFKGNATESIAINPAMVATVFEIVDEGDTELTAIYLQTGITLTVTDPYLEVVARLNEV